ncbi:Imidazolonepropionase [Flavobacteriaceae bacterium MAR_2010_188]|nr:Imidazolonepropionase [Flavobacteriaceae bacterium MAR_2010_188]
MNKVIFYSIFFIFIFSCKNESEADNKGQSPESYDLVLSNANVISLETGEVSLSDVYINQGRIVKISSPDDKEKNNAMKRFNVSGKYLLPGFWDNHVHFRGGDSLIKANKDFLQLYLNNGITTVRDAGGDLALEVNKWKKEIESNILAGPMIFTSGAKIDGPKATWAGSLEVENDDNINKALDSLQSLKVDFVKLYDSTISGENYLETIRQAANRGLITSGHMPFSVTVDETVKAGIGAIEHLYYVLKGCSSEEEEITEAIKKKEIGFWESLAQLRKTYNDSTASETFQLLKDNNVYVVPTLHIGGVLSYLDEVDHSKDDYLSLMEPGFIKTYEGRINGALNASAKARQERKELDTFFQKLTKNLQENGVSLLAGSDTGAFNSYVYPGISLHKELEAMVKAGLTPLETLRASAYNGARFLKKDTDYGTVEVGKVADLVILNGNPLKNIAETQNINMVIKNGFKVEMVDLSNDSSRKN